MDTSRQDRHLLGIALRNGPSWFSRNYPKGHGNEACNGIVSSSRSRLQQMFLHEVAAIPLPSFE